MLKINNKLSLEPFSTSDEALLNTLYNNQEVTKYGTLKYSYPVSDSTIKYLLKTFTESRSDKFYTIKHEDEKVGMAQILQVDNVNRKCKVGILLTPDSFGLGYGSLVLEELINICFNHMNLHKIELEIAENNVHSIRLAEKHHFQKEGTLKESFYTHGKYKDILLYGLIKGEQTKI
ncbi:diamine N-acetyltransferase [Bacillus mesophilus]|uniref:GNAT family N-acetyltransferase n=1 Tax=Bacillus mesophilus TaxID=1808955 RepID=A0A6M0Q9Q0_9BACI|nr:GNAT family protein [Bacillus mesophilus]MBM7662274.1 diamine N-acetyltransferase [Bacillus mesophilus]NEY73091.1 GNAT family N-acetyltransferase [Bacillus mesophilus]